VELDLQHHLFALTLDGVLGLSPPNSKDAKVHRVLDVGTGTGIWAIDYGMQYPNPESNMFY
jgi:methylase of polypeptide subunit release factors